MEPRHSLDIVLDFPALIKAKKAELAAQQQQEKGENIEQSSDTNIINVSAQFASLYEACADNSMTENADETFGVFERMCDKTGSDPDNTLFQYLHSDDKDQILALAKERSARADKSDDMEVDALRRLFDDLNGQDRLENESPLKSADCTRLEDVEAPSRFWDSTLMDNDSAFQPLAKTSPVKMVGLMRPSTILEANEADMTGQQSADSSSSLTNNNSSFLTAPMLKTAQSYETIASGSSCYQSAGDNSRASIEKVDEMGKTLNVDDLFYAAIAKAKPHGISPEEQKQLLSDFHETVFELVDNDEADNTIIELSSTDEEEDEDAAKDKDDLDADIKQEKISTIGVAIEEGEDKENTSMEFNDTIEEMDYRMRKGRELIAAKAAAAAVAASAVAQPATPSPKASPAATPTKPLADSNIIHLHPKQNTFVLTPKKRQPISASPSPSSSLQKGANSSSKLHGSAGKYSLLVLAKKQDKFFKEPSGIPMRRQQLAVKDNYAHIVSPIRAYTHKSGTAPLMSMFRQTSNIKDAFDKLSSKEMELESYLCQLKRGQATESKLGVGCIDATARLLPKKAYISSELTQIVDERTRRPMPHVPKIQKYLDSAVEPTVMRHDGKMKMAGESPLKRPSHIPRPNESLADLSLASGDISLYTLKDAQKF
ncbi:uncharacterized protein LOC6567020 isoform X2 [Drosophila grimshawi]|nr:uncharacterized protein LOC6567020 isoform X2 [Drosophila grimshawi]